MGLPNCWRSLAYWVGDVEGVAGPADRGGGLEDGAVEHRPVPGLPVAPVDLRAGGAVEVDPVLGVGGDGELLGQA